MISPTTSSSSSRPASSTATSSRPPRTWCLRLLKAGVLTNLNPVLEANDITTLSQAHDYITVDGGVMGLDVVTVVFGLFYNTGALRSGRRHRAAGRSDASGWKFRSR